MPCALIINTLADVLAELLFEAVCIFLYDFLDFTQFVFGDSRVLSQFHVGLQPVLGLVAAEDDVDVHPLLLVGIYLERVFALASEYWTHNLLLLAGKAAVKRGPLSMLIWPSVSSLAAFTPQRYEIFRKQILFPRKINKSSRKKGGLSHLPLSIPRPVPKVVVQAFSCLYYVHHVVG